MNKNLTRVAAGNIGVVCTLKHNIRQGVNIHRLGVSHVNQKTFQKRGIIVIVFQQIKAQDIF